MNIVDIFKNSEENMLNIWSGEENNSEFKMLLDGMLVIHCKYKNGKKHGFSKEYDPITGIILTDCCYYDGKLEGEFRAWNFEKILIIHKLYSNDKVIEDYLEK